MMRFSIPMAFAAALMLAGCGATPDAAQNASEDMAAAPAADAQPDGLAFCDAVMTRVSADECTDLTALKDTLYRGGGAIHADTPMQRGKSYTVTLLLDSRTARAIDTVEQSRPEPSIAAPAPTPSKKNGPAAGPQPAETAPPQPAPASTDPARAAEDQAPTPYEMLERLPGTAEKFTPWVGRFMRAELRGDGFRITALDDEAKELPDASQARWTWSVVPVQGGTQTLFVTTKVEGRVNGKTYLLRGSETFRSITVEVSLLDRARDQFVYFADWLKSLEGLIVAITAVAVAFFGLRAVFRNNRRKPADPPPSS